MVVYWTSRMFVGRLVSWQPTYLHSNRFIQTWSVVGNIKTLPQNGQLLLRCMSLNTDEAYPWILTKHMVMIQAMEEEYTKLAESHGSKVQIAKFQADVDRDFAQNTFGLQTFPTIVLLPKSTSSIIKYPSERRDVETWSMWLSSILGWLAYLVLDWLLGSWAYLLNKWVRIWV